ncbi:MAG: LysR substrate-binding domain-containing protein, partial [Paracoccaceae bacterium]|nr:LysR substrate-binding domain-containing protein [Paracoccaceae bacterium]
LAEPKDMQNQRLISVESDKNAETYPGWQEWASAYNVSLHPESVGVHFAHAFPAIEAALSGQGVALISQSNISRYLRNGELILPFGDEFTLELPRYILIDANQTSPACKRLHEWLIQNCN